MARLLLRLLADPTRMGIVELLAEADRTVGELADALGTPRSRLGNHLACGLHCGVWTSERRGRHVVYSLADRAVLGLLEHAREVAAKDPAVGEAALEIARLYYDARYAGHAPDDARVKALLDRLAA